MLHVCSSVSPGEFRSFLSLSSFPLPLHHFLFLFPQRIPRPKKNWERKKREKKGGGRLFFFASSAPSRWGGSDSSSPSSSSLPCCQRGEEKRTDEQGLPEAGRRRARGSGEGGKKEGRGRHFKAFVWFCPPFPSSFPVCRKKPPWAQQIRRARLDQQPKKNEEEAHP